LTFEKVQIIVIQLNKNDMQNGFKINFQSFYEKNNFSASDIKEHELKIKAKKIEEKIESAVAKAESEKLSFGMASI
jgi:hypothetical protein